MGHQPFDFISKLTVMNAAPMPHSKAKYDVAAATSLHMPRRVDAGWTRILRINSNRHIINEPLAFMNRPL